MLRIKYTANIIFHVTDSSNKGLLPHEYVKNRKEKKSTHSKRTYK